MKKIITLVISLGAVLYLSGISAYSQGKGPGQARPVNQGHSQGAGNSHQANGASSSDHGKSESWQTTLNERFDTDAKLRARMQSLLPQGMDLKTAESGFKTHGQFIAALHVSKNLMIPFDQLKTKMTGVSVSAAGQTSNATPMSLGKAIHELRPDMAVNQANEEAKKAEKQAAATEKGSPTT
jgi:hypothetical protein